MNRPPKLSIIAALAENRVIGRENRLPWRLPADLAHFKRLTLGKPIVMGRRTWESLPGLLPHRTHIVVTRDRGYIAQGAEVAHSLDDALALVGGAEEVMIIGGADLYRQTLPFADRLYLTLIHEAFEGDAYFPPVDPERWCEVSRETRPPDEKNPIALTFVTYERPGPD